MALRRATLIFNPNAGSLRWRDIIEPFAIYWQQRGWHVIIAPTQRAGHASELAREAANRGDELVFAAGGDGTMHEVANGLANTRTALAPLPVGTANIFAKELGIPTPSLLNPEWMESLLATLASGRIQLMDLGRTDEGRHWLLWASTGADGFVIDRVEPRTRRFKRLGRLGYATKALWFLPNFSGITGRITVDEHELEGDFLMVNVSNCRHYASGDFVLNRQATLDDGEFEVWIFRGKQWPMLLRYSLVVGMDSHELDPNIEVFQASRVQIETDEAAPYHLDAEPAGQTPLAVAIQPGALRVLVPQKTPHGLFAQAGDLLEET